MLAASVSLSSNIRADFVLSYWVFTWFLLYIFHIVDVAPFLLIILGLVFSVIELFYLIFVKASTYNIVKFTVINTIFKSLPIYMLWGTTISRYEMKCSILFLLTYIIWLYIHNINPIKVYTDILYSYRTGNGKKTVISETYDFLYDTVCSK